MNRKTANVCGIVGVAIGCVLIPLFVPYHLPSPLRQIVETRYLKIGFATSGVATALLVTGAVYGSKWWYLFAVPVGLLFLLITLIALHG